jgi:N-acetylmuramoyl-L-alanine amidase
MPRPVRWRSVLALLAITSVISQWGCVPSENEKRVEDAEWGRIKIVLDPGHGGRDVGASPDGAPFEKDIVLDITLQVERLLKRKGMQVMVTRRTDVFIPLSGRAEIANSDHATLFVSIHANSCPRKEVTGFEIYYAGDRREKESIQAANFLQQSIKKATGASDRGIRKQNYTVLARTECPSVLIEVGYLTNPREAELLSRRSYRRKVAEGTARGIIAYARTRL